MSSTKKNIIYNVVYQILIIFLPLITAPYLARVLGATGIGIYSYTYSIAHYFVLFAMLGISNYGNRSIAAVRDDKEKLSKTFWSIYFMQIITSVAACLIYIFYVLVFSNEYKLIALIQLIYVLSSVLDINWFFFGMGKFKITVLRNAAIKLITLVGIFTFVKNANDLWKYTLILSIGTLLSQSYVWIYIKKYIKWVKINWKDIKIHLKPNLILFIPVISYSVYKIMDKIMLGNMCSVADVGLYENAEKIINIPQGIITAIGTVMLSKMSNMVQKENNENVKGYIAISMKYVTIMACAMMFGLMAVGRTFAPIYYGNEFYITGELIQYMSCIVLFVSWANVIRTQYLIPYQKDKIYLTSTILGAVVNLIFNLILIPKLQAYGAVVGTILAEFTVMFIQLISTRKELKIKTYIKNAIPFIIIGIIMYGGVVTVNSILGGTVISLIMQIIIGASIYIILSTIYLYMQKDELVMGTLKKIKEKFKNRGK